MASCQRGPKVVKWSNRSKRNKVNPTFIPLACGGVFPTCRFRRALLCGALGVDVPYGPSSGILLSSVFTNGNQYIADHESSG